MHAQPRTEESIQKAEKRLMKRQEERKRKLAEVGIKYDFDAVAYVSVLFRSGCLATTAYLDTHHRQKKKPKAS